MGAHNYIVSLQPDTKRGPSLTPIKVIKWGYGIVAHLSVADARALAAALIDGADALDQAARDEGKEVSR